MRINQTNSLNLIQESLPETNKNSVSPVIDDRKDVFEPKVSSITGVFARSRDFDSARENIKASRDEYKTKLQEEDKKEQDAMEILIALSKTLNQTRLSNIKI